MKAINLKTDSLMEVKPPEGYRWLTEDEVFHMKQRQLCAEYYKEHGTYPPEWTELGNWLVTERANNA